MIKDKSSLKIYLTEDRKANVGNISNFQLFIHRIFGSDFARAYFYLKSLRKYEYAINCIADKYGFLGKIVLAYYKYVYNRQSIKTNIRILPNIIGYGFKIAHVVGGGIIINAKSIGNYCTVNVNVVVGNKNTIDEIAEIGNHVNICTGSKIIGKVKIGNNVTIAPNAVVLYDIEDNCIVGGIPAKVLKLK